MELFNLLTKYQKRVRFDPQKSRKSIQLFIFTEKFSPCRDLNPGPPRDQANMLQIELSWLGCFGKS